MAWIHISVGGMLRNREPLNEETKYESNTWKKLLTGDSIYMGRLFISEQTFEIMKKLTVSHLVITVGDHL